MATLSTTKNYAEGFVLFASDLSDFLDDIEYFLNVTKISDSNILTDGLTGSDVLADASITTSKLQSNVVTTAKLATSSIETDLINTDAVTTAKLADTNVTTAKINDLAITTAKLTDASVTSVKRAAINYAFGNSSGSLSSTSETAISQATLTTTGRSVQIILMSDQSAVSSTLASYIGVQTNGGTVAVEQQVRFIVYRDSTVIARQIVGVNNFSTGPLDMTLFIPPSLINHLDITPAAGTYTYKVSMDSLNSTEPAVAVRCKLFVREF